MSRTVVSFTSSPSRLPRFLPVLATLMGSHCPVDAWQLHLPHRYRNDEPYPDVLLERIPPAVQLVRHAGTDPGPALKLLGALRVESDPTTVILTIDDDVAYPPDWLDTLLARQQAHRGAAVGTKGFLWADGQLKPMRKTGAACDVLQGYGGVAYPRHGFDEQGLSDQLADAPDALRYSDDILLSNHLAARGVARTIFIPDSGSLSFLPWGDTDPQALKHRGGGVHARYRDAADALKHSGSWALANG